MRDPLKNTLLARRQHVISYAAVTGVAALLAATSGALAADGTWTNANGGDWNLATTSNWLGGVVANGADAVARFDTLDVNSVVNVNVTEDRTIGTLSFGDTDVASPGGWALSGSTITLAGAAPTISVGTLAADQNVTINNALAGTAGFTKSGAGTLVLAGTTTGLTGTYTLAGGTLVRSGNLTNLVTVAPGASATILSRGDAAYANVGGSADSTLTMVLESNGLFLPTLTVDGNWANGGNVGRVNFVGDPAFGGFVRLRPNGGTPNLNTATAFQNTLVNLDNVILFTRTNSGGNTVNIGALSGTSTATLTGGGQSGGSLAIYSIGALNTNTEFAGTINTSSAPTPGPGGLSLTKVGTGTLTLSGTLSYQPTNNGTVGVRGGITTVQAGTLKLTNAAAIPGGITDSGGIYSVIDVRAGATLDVSGASTLYSTANLQRLVGTGTIAGNYRHDEGQLAPADTVVLTSPNLTAVVGTINFANDLTIDGGQINYDLGGAGSDQIVVGGTLNLGGNTTLATNFVGPVTAGVYVVATAGSISGSASGWTIPFGGRGTPPSLAVVGNQLQLTVSAVAGSGSVTWTGANGAEWDVNTSVNWRNEATGNPDRFFQNDAATFGNGPVTTTAITLNTTVSPLSVTVNSSANEYSITGSGKITGPGTLSKSGTSTLTLRTANDFTGGTTISGGTIDIGLVGTALGTGPITFSGGRLVNAGVALGNPMTFTAATNNTIAINGSPNNGSIVLGGSFSGDGNLTITGTANGRLLDLGTTTNFTGDLTVTPDLVDTTQTFLTVRTNGASGGFGSSVLTLNAGTTLADRATSAQTINIGALAGSTGSLIRGYQGGSGATAKTYRIGSLNVDSTYAGDFGNGGGSSNTTSPIHIVKLGTGTLTLSGQVVTVTTTANSVSVVHPYSGSFAVEAGKLVLGAGIQPAIFGGANVSATPGGADVRGGILELNYTGSTSPAASVATILDAGYDLSTKFLTGRIRSTTLAAGRVLGWIDRPAQESVTIAATRQGDTNVDLVVNFDDLLSLAQNYDASVGGRVWSQGDSNYDGFVNFDDLLSLAQNYGLPALAGEQVALVGADFAADFALAQSLVAVPEPATLGLLAGGLMLVGRRRRGC